MQIYAIIGRGRIDATPEEDLGDLNSCPYFFRIFLSAAWRIEDGRVLLSNRMTQKFH